jgi:hypothetical protein
MRPAMKPYKILDLTDGRGTDCGCECVGYQCCNKHGHEDNSITMNSLVASTKTGELVWLAYLFLRIRELASDLAKQGKMPFDFGSFLA